MALFKKKGKLDSEGIKSEYAKLEEQRVPNHWSYNDDPLLNLEPVFADDVNNKVDINKLKENVSKSSGSGVTDKIKEMRDRIGASQKQEPKIAGPLGDIIGAARQKSASIQEEVIENDPVIAKLQRIEELKRTGGTDSELYTDLTKSAVQSYAQRAKEFHQEHMTVHLETELERKKRLAKEAEEKRKSGIDITKTMGYFDSVTPNRKVKTDDNLEKQLKNIITQIKEVKKEQLDKDALKAMELVKNKEFDSETKKKHYLNKKIKEFNEILEQAKKDINSNSIIKSTKYKKDNNKTKK